VRLLCAPTLSQIEGSKTQSGYEWPKPRHISAPARTYISVCTVLSLADADAFATVRGPLSSASVLGVAVGEEPGD